jgi:hypothetical protein
VYLSFELSLRLHTLLMGSAAAGCWLLAAGCWLLAAGCWLLAAGCWLLAAGCWLLAAGCWLLPAGCWLLAAVAGGGPSSDHPLGFLVLVWVE